MKTLPALSLKSSFLAASVLVALLAPAHSQQQPAQSAAPGDGTAKADDYVRYVEGEQSDRLQTAIVRFVRGTRVVDLVAAVHIADVAYYDRLNEHLKGYDAVLYELVGGEYQSRDERFGPETMRQVKLAQSLVRTVFGMEYQTEGIDYEAANFVHADVDWKEYAELMEARNQSMATIFQRALMQAQNGKLPGIAGDEEAASDMFNTLITALARGDTAELKRSVAPLLGEAETFITQLEGEDGTVLVSERNKVVVRVLEEQLSQGRNNVGILYGAGHMPDLARRLEAAGFHRQDDTWLTAWDIRDSQPSGEPVNMWQQLFSDPELTKTIMGTVQEIMKQFRENLPAAGSPADTQ